MFAFILHPLQPKICKSCPWHFLIQIALSCKTYDPFFKNKDLPHFSKIFCTSTNMQHMYINRLAFYPDLQVAFQQYTYTHCFWSSLELGEMVVGGGIQLSLPSLYLSKTNSTLLTKSCGGVFELHPILLHFGFVTVKCYHSNRSLF